MLKNAVILLSLLFINSFAYTAEPDTTQNFDSLNVRHFQFLSLKYDFLPNSTAIGNSLTDFQIYNPIIAEGYHYFDLGNIGSAYHLGRLGQVGSVGFNYWPINAKRAFLFQTKNIGYYNSEKAYSRVDYTNGAQKENYARAIIARNFGEYFNLGFQYSRINSEGFYVRQLNSYSNIAGFAKLYSRNKKYLLLVNGAFNGNTNQENGGLSSDSLFESNASSNRKLLPTNLSSAESRMRKRSAFVYQSYDFSRSEKDTTSNDTIVDRFNEGRIFRIAHSFEYLMHMSAYDDTDPLSGFYSNVYLDSTITADSARYRNITNTASLIYFGKDTINGNKKFGLSLDLKWEGIKISQTLSDTLDTLSIKDELTNLTAQVGGTYRSTLIDIIKVSGSYGIGGYNQGDNGLKARLIKYFGPVSLAFNANHLQQTPAYFYTNFSSNHFRWSNSFKRITTENVGFDFVWSKANLSASANYNLMQNLVYLDTSSMPVQHNGTINVLSAELRHHLKWSVFNLQSRGLYQNVNGADVLRLPQVLLHETIAYEDWWFKDKLFVRLGFDIFYNTKFYANAYNPDLGQFHLQNETEIGNYPYIDFFFNFRIKRFRAFLKMEHVNSGLMGYTYYSSPHYPAKDRAFKFGISWAFLD